MYGNMLSRWTNFLTEDGEKEWRKRDAEFEEMQISKQDLISFWNDGWRVLIDTLKNLQPEDLIKTIHIRTEPLIVYDAIIRQMAHYPYHVGQIVQIAKMMRDKEFKSLSIPKGGSQQFNQQMSLGWYNAETSRMSAQRLIDEARAKNGDTESSSMYAENIVSKAGEAITKLLNGNPFQTGIPAQATSWISSSPAGDLEQVYETLRANIGFEALGKMRANSPTGAGVS